MKRLAGWGVVLVDVLALCALRPDLDRLGHGLRAPRSWIDGGADRALITLVGAAIWLVAAWVALGLLLTAARALPGTVGRTANRWSVAVLPAAVQRVLAGSVGLGVLLAPVVAGAASPVSTAVRQTGVTAAAPGPAWPTAPAPSGTGATGGSTPAPTDVTTSQPPAASPTTVPAPLPAPRWPDGSTTPSTAHPAPSTTTPTPTPAAPRTSTPTPDTPTPDTPAPSTSTPRSTAPPRRPTPGTPTPVPDRPARTTATTVRVRAGDSLWLLAARRLRETGPDDDAAVAAYWPRLYAANRDVVGDDPALITPGQVLHLPMPARTSDPTHQEQS